MAHRFCWLTRTLCTCHKVFAIHGFRYATRTLFNTLEARYYNQTWPGQNLAHDSAAIASAILDRIQYSGGMYQMFG